MKLKLLNSKSGKEEFFEPLDQNCIKMYVCGPTVYQRPHLGNLRNVLVFDVLYRLLKSLYPKVSYVRNITDVDDKIINESIKTNKPISQITSEVERQFQQDCEYLNCLSPDVEPRATQEIDGMIKMIQILIDRGFAYKSDDGNVLFEVNKFKEYGHLSHRLNLDEMVAGARIDVENYKKNENDFVLWKPSDNDYGWDSPFGFGRPGWHIECSAMSYKYLGSSFDIHGGGIDLLFPHHENEVAQSICCYDGDFAKYWVHNGFLTINGQKMSKSVGNIFNIDDLKTQHNIHSEHIRYILLSSHYRKPLDLNDHLINSSKLILNKFYSVICDSEIDLKDCQISNLAIEMLCDNLNLAKYFAKMLSLYKDIRDTLDKKTKDNLIKELYSMGYFIGFFKNINNKSHYLIIQNKFEIPFNIKELAEKRIVSKKNRDFTMADKLRQEISDSGYDILDTQDGYEITKR